MILNNGDFITGLNLCICLNETYRVFNGPVREKTDITQMSEVVDVAEQLIVQLWEVDHRNGAVLVERPCVALQPGAKISNVSSYLFNHKPPKTEQIINFILNFRPFRRTMSKTGGVYLISLLQIASGVSNSPRNISEMRSAS